MFSNAGAAVLDHFSHPQNMGAMEDADLTGQEGFPGEGPFMILHRKLVDDHIALASFETYGCPSAIACGSWLTTWLKGKTRDQAALVEARDLIVMLKLQIGKEHCGIVATKALSSALKQRY